MTVGDEIRDEKLKIRYSLRSSNDHNDLTYFLKNDTAKKCFDDFDNGIELFRKIKFGEMKLEKAKEL